MQAKYAIGQIIHHRLFNYRGVVFDVDPVFSGSDEWYDQVARSRPPKDEPWYHVLVDQADHTTYVAERNLQPSDDTAPIQHPAVEGFFNRTETGAYQPKIRVQ